MPNLTVKSAPDTHIPLDDTLDRLRDTPYVNLGSGSDVTIVDKQWASLSGDRERLDRGDLFFALANPKIFGRAPIIAKRLYDHLGYYPDDGLQFQAIALSPTAQLAMVVIEPKHLNSQAPTVIVATNYAHPSALYVRSMQMLANTLHSKVVLYDQPGMGCSQTSSSVNQSDFYQALKMAIRVSVPQGGRYYVVAHGFGSSGAYQLFNDIYQGKNPVNDRSLVRMMLVNPIPTRVQENAEAGKLAPSFFWTGATNLLDNNLSEYMRVRTRRLIEREAPAISVAGMASTLGNLDTTAMLDAIGRDDRIAVVMGKDDRLMNWNSKAFANTRGYYIINSDHGGFLIDAIATDADIQNLASILTTPQPHEVPPMAEESIYGMPSGAVRLGAVATTESRTALFVPEITARVGLTKLGNSAGIFCGGGFFAELGHAYSANDWVASTQTYAFVGVEHLRLPVEILLGVRGGINYVDPFRSISTGALGMLRINLSRIVDVDAQVRTGWTGQLQDVLVGLRLRIL